MNYWWLNNEENTRKGKYEKGNEIYVITNDGSEFSIKVNKDTLKNI
jgi:hypothetical protein